MKLDNPDDMLVLALLLMVMKEPGNQPLIFALMYILLPEK